MKSIVTLPGLLLRLLVLKASWVGAAASFSVPPGPLAFAWDFSWAGAWPPLCGLRLARSAAFL